MFLKEIVLKSKEISLFSRVFFVILYVKINCHCRVPLKRNYSAKPSPEGEWTKYNITPYQIFKMIPLFKETYFLFIFNKIVSRLDREGNKISGRGEGIRYSLAFHCNMR